MQNKCFNCLYFFSCNKADQNTKECLYFKETNIKEISKDDNYTQRSRMVD